jgi:cytochrome c biogenesis protein CcmG, thiol:disulfide interchange protein DsbE
MSTTPPSPPERVEDALPVASSNEAAGTTVGPSTTQLPNPQPATLSDPLDGHGSSPAARQGRVAWIITAVGIALIAAVVVALVANRSSSSDEVVVAPTSVSVDGSTVTTPPVVSETNPVVVSGAPLIELPESGQDAAVGSVAPTVTGTQLVDGKTVTVPVAGRPTLVVFVAHWCPHCRREVPVLVDWLSSGALGQDVDVALVSTAVSAERDNYPPSSWLVKENWTYTAMTDDEAATAAQAWGLTGFPFMVLVDADGKVVARTSGEKSVAELNDFVRPVIAT